MKTSGKLAMSAASGLLAVLSLGPASAQQDMSRTIEQYACKDVMRENGTNRDVAIAFLHGFLLGKSSGSKFDLDKLHNQTNEFIERCLDNPTENAVEVMSKVKS